MVAEYDRSHFPPILVTLASWSASWSTVTCSPSLPSDARRSFMVRSLESCDNLTAHVSLGCYSSLFAISIYLMIKRSRNQNLNRPIFTISIFLYLCCFAHFVLEFINFYTTLVCATRLR